MLTVHKGDTVFLFNKDAAGGASGSAGMSSYYSQDKEEQDGGQEEGEDGGAGAGEGWTEVCNESGNWGFVPTDFIHCSDEGVESALKGRRLARDADARREREAWVASAQKGSLQIGSVVVLTEGVSTFQSGDEIQIMAPRPQTHSYLCLRLQDEEVAKVRLSWFFGFALFFRFCWFRFVFLFCSRCCRPAQFLTQQPGRQCSFLRFPCARCPSRSWLHVVQ